MSHLTPHRSVRITPGGAAADHGRAAGPPAAHDTSWDGLIADLATAIGLEGDAATDFAAKANDVVDAFAGYGDPEVARTRVRAALLGNPQMLGDDHAIGLSDQHVDALLDTWDLEHTPDHRVVGRLALLHEALAGPALPPGPGDTVGEGSGGSAEPLPVTVPEPDVHVGQVAYTAGQVPATAKGVIVWIGNADTEDDRRARAQAALEVEEQREERRKTVVEAIAGVLDG